MEDQIIGLQPFLLVIEKLGLDKILHDAKCIYLEHSLAPPWGPGWSRFRWSFGSAWRTLYRGITSFQGDIAATFCLEEVLTPEQIHNIGNELNIEGSFKDSRPE